MSSLPSTSPESGGLYQAASAISLVNNLQTVCTSVAGHLNRLLPADRTVLHLVDHTRRQVLVAAGAGDVRPERDLQVDYEEISRGLGGQVWRTGQPLLSLSAQDGLEPEATRARRERDGTGALIIAPLRLRGEVVGTITALKRLDQPPFTEEDAATLMTLASLASASIENVGLVQVEQQRRHLAEALEHAGRELARSLDVRQMPELILSQAGQVAPHDQGVMLLEEDGAWTLAASTGFEGPAPAGAFARQARSLLQPALASGSTGLAEADGFTWLAAALMLKGRPAGLLILARAGASAFGEPEVEAVAAYAARAAPALENARLYDETARFGEMMERMVEARVAELHEAMRTLEQVDKTKSRFIEITAHELRTPLTLVKGYGSMLAGMTPAKGPETQPLMDGILAGVNRLHEIVNSMLDVAKIDSQTLNMRRTPLKFGLILRRVLSDYQAALAERNLSLTFEGLEDLPAVEADPDLMRKAFHQLVGNAIKYTPDGGRITVSGQRIAGGSEEGSAIELALADTGVGIDPEYHDLIFERFYQLGEVALHSSGRTKYKGGGPGLGLAIVRGIIHAHGGKIWVESPGHDEQACPGSRFVILLPLNA